MRSIRSRSSISSPCVVAEQVQEPVHERLPPRVAHDLRADDEIAERARQPVRQLLAPVEREREHVRRLVDPEVLLLQRPALVRGNEREPELALLDPLGGENALCELDRGGLVDLRPAPVLDLDSDHRHLPLAGGARLFGVELVRLDDPLHELVPDDVLVRELDEADPVDRAEDVAHLDQA